AFAKRQRQSRGLVVFEVVECRVGAGQADDLVEEELQILWNSREKLQLRLLHATTELPLFVAGAQRSGGLQNQGDMIENHRGNFQPGGLIGVKFHLAVAVIAQEFFERAQKIGKRRK